MIKALVTMMAAWMVVLMLAGWASSAPEPIVQKGQLYVIVESCTAMTMKCFGELHRVTAVLDNQWIETLQCEDDACAKAKTTWRINLARVYAIRPFRGDGRDAH